MRERRTCTIPRCDVKHYAKGLCDWHYHRRREGDIAALFAPRPVKHCADCGADLPRMDMRLCAECKPVAPAVPWVNPLTCECPVTLADPRINFGECPACRCKPRSLMAVAS